MGYRSEVFIKVVNSDKDELIELLKKHDLESCFSVHSDEDHTHCYAGWLKWYDGYGDIDAIEAFVDDEDHYGSRALLTIGEDNATTECGNCSAMNLFVVCDIDTDHFPIQELR